MINKYTFQDPASEYARNLIDLHHFIMFILIVVFVIVAALLLRIILYFRDYNDVRLFSSVDFDLRRLYIDFVGQKLFVYSDIFNNRLFYKKLYVNANHFPNWFEYVSGASATANYFKAFYKRLNDLPYIYFENVRHGTRLEIFWTLVPTFILVLIAMPSFALLYSYDEPLSSPCVTLKAIGHQWY
jgi:heme/copper-type cytochrome/quinol oxidase subunit 2